MKYIIIATTLCLLLLSGCSGKDKLTVDKIPPLNPIMIAHLGDTGDLDIMHNGQHLVFNEENNGIDAVPDGDWIRISWEHLLDTDLDYLKVYRFDEFNVQPALIDSISASREYYIDNKVPLNTYVLYSYFIEAVDNAGNSSLSDTVSYSLISKQRLISAEWTSDGFKFSWQRSGFVSKFRLLIFNADGEYVWHRDVQVAAEGDYFHTFLPSNLATQFAGQEMRWRIDAFNFDIEQGIFFGSESEERLFTTSTKH